MKYLPLVAAVVFVLSGCTGSTAATGEQSISEDEVIEEKSDEGHEEIARGQPSSSDGDDDLASLCRGRTPCEKTDRMELDGPDTEGALLFEIALHELGEEGRRPHAECAPFEYWLVDDDGTTTMLLEVCNHGYGAAGMGRDEVTVDGDYLHYSQFGGSNWRWSTTTTVDLARMQIEEEKMTGSFTMGSNVERQTWSWSELAGFVHWKAPGCDDEQRVHEPHLDMHNLEDTAAPTYRYDLIPQISLPDDFTGDDWESTDLGTCAIEVNARAHTNDVSGQGFVVHGEPGDARDARDARFDAVMGSPTELYVEITDPDWNVDNESWLYQDHLEIWVGEQTTYHSQCLDPDAPSQWAISLVDGAIHPAHGSPDEGALQADVARHSRENLEKIRVKIEFAEPPEALSIVYSDTFTGERQDRMIATSDLRAGDAATLGKTRVIDPEDGHCFVNEQGELQFEDRRRFEALEISPR